MPNLFPAYTESSVNRQSGYFSSLTYANLSTGNVGNVSEIGDAKTVDR